MIKKVTGFIFILAAIALLCGGVYLFYPKLADYKKSRDLYNGIEKQYTSEQGSLKIPDGEDSSDESESIKEIDPLLSVSPSKKPKEKNKEKQSRWTWKGKVKTSRLRINGKLVDINDYPCIDVDSESLVKENPDYIGWIYVPGTTISYPVVRSKDNEDYLHVNFQKQYNYPGTIFMDCRCKDEEEDLHTVIYGHNMRDNSMFAQIKSYADEKYLAEHPFFWFITGEKKMLFQVFSAYETDPEDETTFGFDGKQYKTAAEYEKFIKNIASRSIHPVDASLDSSSHIMTLSTCTNSRVTRFTVHGVCIGEFH